MKAMLLAALLPGILVGMAFASSQAASPRPVVVELFTSQACSDCPPADALLRHVQARHADVLALDLHVTYWNSLAWRDPFATKAATARQGWYAGLRHGTEVYTPQAVVDGRAQFVGSDAGAMRAAIGRARRVAGQPVPVSIAAAGTDLVTRISAGQGTGTIWLFGFDPKHVTHVSGGENGGATLTEVNVVRSITSLGAWRGQAITLALKPPAGLRHAVLVQRDDGTILGAAAN